MARMRSSTSPPSSSLHVAHPRCVAIGEAGLDYHYDKSPREAQAQGLRTHIAAARMTQLPLVIHSRQADDDMIAILREEMGKGAFPAILHCFTAGEALAMAGVELGLYVSFSGILTFKTSEELRRIARLCRSDRLLVETDAPYLAPTSRSGASATSRPMSLRQRRFWANDRRRLRRDRGPDDGQCAPLLLEDGPRRAGRAGSL
jgi:TatD family hydrolase